MSRRASRNWQGGLVVVERPHRVLEVARSEVLVANRHLRVAVAEQLHGPLRNSGHRQVAGSLVKNLMGGDLVGTFLTEGCWYGQQADTIVIQTKLTQKR